MSLQQAQLQTAAAHSGLQVALQQLERLKDQLQDSSSVVENTVKTVTETNQLVAHTDTAGPSKKSNELNIQNSTLVVLTPPILFVFSQ